MSGVGKVTHTDIAAYVLGVLDDADNAAFEAHLLDCPNCQLDLLELHGLPDILNDVRRYWPEPPVPAPRVLAPMLDEVADIRRRRTLVRRLVAVAALLLIIAGPLVTLAVTPSQAPAPAVASGPPPPPPPPTTGGSRFTGSETGQALRSEVFVMPTEWGAAVRLDLSGVSGPLRCHLVAVDWAGRQETVASWTVPAVKTEPMLISGGTAFEPQDIEKFQIRTESGAVVASIER
ncbi:zf-HC2 domain-containing protein [Amycolatopsis endophytica]|uniref:Anti-sigma factor RsiW n=1 Tax=Amycolatopsis endophytica TaxID=860233 RepID=A0A853B7F1_9PSEU|nr:zf-HC2 domain-containing protein [Amycolatopsis endophytica]NYI90641.1 anti-sigma factor RsiW [Amycolatopsis endophytica]